MLETSDESVILEERKNQCRDLKVIIEKLDWMRNCASRHAMQESFMRVCFSAICWRLDWTEGKLLFTNGHPISPKLCRHGNSVPGLATG